ncbi:unnamed protein product [Bubo scandiacus]
MQLRQAKCIRDFNRALALCPSHFQAYMSCAAYYGSKGRYSKAILNCNEAIKILPNMFFHLQTFNAAIEDLSKTIDLNKTCILAYYNRAICYHQIKDFRKQVQKDFLRAIHLNPKCIKARICLGYNLETLGKLQRAWRQFTVAICIDPKCRAAYDGRTSVCLQMGETFAAFQDTNAAISKNPSMFSFQLTTTAPLLTNQGVINELMGYLPCAMKDYQQAISVDTNYALAYFNAANIYFHN